MGSCISRDPEVNFDAPVDFNHFHILRAIGKGAFGKVCIVKKKDTKQMYAMKYMNKVQIIHKHAVENVMRESEILRQLDNPFLVNLWFAFQDREDIFMVLDLMLGGDLNYHLEKEGRFSVARVRLYLAELGLALDYLREKKVIHRDVKPANTLLDSGGHAHLTDFNVACIVQPDVPVVSVTGTKPYMAPEVLNSRSSGYSYAVDWWSLGVSAYEMLRGQRPFTIERGMSNDEIASSIKRSRPSASVRWDQHTCDLLKMLLHPDSAKRLKTLDDLKAHPFFKNLEWEKVEAKEVTPPYIPSQNRIHCDPTHELEEMIVEPNPLHKKQYRLSRRNVKAEDDVVAEELARFDRRFTTYNRIRLRESEALQQAAVAETDNETSQLSESESTPLEDPEQPRKKTKESNGEREKGGSGEEGRAGEEEEEGGTERKEEREKGGGGEKGRAGEEEEKEGGTERREEREKGGGGEKGRTGEEEEGGTERREEREKGGGEEIVGEAKERVEGKKKEKEKKEKDLVGVSSVGASALTKNSATPTLRTNSMNSSSLLLPNEL